MGMRKEDRQREQHFDEISQPKLKLRTFLSYTEGSNMRHTFSSIWPHSEVVELSRQESNYYLYYITRTQLKTVGEKNGKNWLSLIYF